MEYEFQISVVEGPHLLHLSTKAWDLLSPSASNKGDAIHVKNPVYNVKVKTAEKDVNISRHHVMQRRMTIVFNLVLNLALLLKVPSCPWNYLHMEHIKNDPELAAEMVQLLGNELKILRKRIRELEVRTLRKLDTRAGNWPAWRTSPWGR